MNRISRRKRSPRFRKVTRIVKLLITLDFPPAVGGIQKYLYGIVKYWYTSKDAVFVGQKHPKKPSHLIDALPATVSRFYSPLGLVYRKCSLISMIVPYVNMWKRFRGTLTVECGNIYSALIPWMLSRVIKQPYVVYTYGTELLALKRKSIKNIILKSVLRRADKIITISEYTKSILTHLGFTQRIDIVNPRIERSLIPRRIRRRDTQTVNVLSVGRLVIHKGSMHLIAAAKTLIERDAAYHVTILGNGPLYEPLRDKCRALGIENSVVIKRNVSDAVVYDEFEKAHVFVLPSIETGRGVEGFGIVLLEAMAHRVPIVASRSGGIPEVLDNGRCGVLVEPGDVADLVYAIDSIKNSPVVAEKYARKSYKRLLENYVWT